MNVKELLNSGFYLYRSTDCNRVWLHDADDNFLDTQYIGCQFGFYGSLSDLSTPEIISIINSFYRNISNEERDEAAELWEKIL